MGINRYHSNNFTVAVCATDVYKRMILIIRRRVTENHRKPEKKIVITFYLYKYLLLFY